MKNMRFQIKELLASFGEFIKHILIKENEMFPDGKLQPQHIPITTRSRVHPMIK